MDPLFIVFAAMTVLFAGLLTVRQALTIKFCVICATVSLSWLTLLGLYVLGLFRDPVLLALLMGQSIVGVYYLLEKHVPKQLLVFRLPFLLTLTLVAYSVLNWRSSLLPAFWLVLGLWVVGRLILAYRADPGRPSLAQKLIDCCGWEKS